LYRLASIALTSITATVILSGCAAGTGPAKHAAAAKAAASTSPSGQAAPTPAPRTTSPSPARTTPSPKAESAADACDSRPNASGDIYVRIVTPGLSPEAQELGGEWRWDYTINKCLTSVQLTIATAPLTAGNCTQVGYVADNPGYDPDAETAAPLKVVAAQAGPAC
jgi:hypothetical protein